jgi:hypothetical protein
MVGSQVTVEDRSTIILLAQNRHGYANVMPAFDGGAAVLRKGRELWEMGRNLPACD